MKYSPKEMVCLLEKNSFSFKKKYGQNFIVDENIIDSIIKKAEIDRKTMVIEIGPGAGSLTYKLATFSKNVLCYEVDTSLKEILEENLKDFENVDIIYDDFLKRDIRRDLEKYSYEKLYVVANLPYYITTPIIIKFIEDKIDVQKLVFMVQKEVGNRFKAVPKSKDYGSLTVYLQYYFDVKKIMDVSRNVFLPKPNVDSIVVSFTRKDKLLPLKNESFFFQLVRDSFQQKRKTIKNNLKDYNLDTIEKVVKENQFTLNSRAEELPLLVFVQIANELSEE